MSNQERFDPIKEITNLGESVGRAIEKGIKSVTSSVAPQIQLDMYKSKSNIVVRTIRLMDWLKIVLK